MYTSMLMPYRFTHYLLVLWLAGPIVFAQHVETVRVKVAQPGPYLRFDQITVDNESFKQASSKSVQLHDSQGYLWLLSDPNPNEGLIRYDGTYAKSFGPASWMYHDGAERSVVREDEYHQIWAANEHGLNLFDPRTETFRAFRNPFVADQALRFWVMGKGGKHWFAGRQPRPLYEFNSRTRRVRQVVPTRLINGYTHQTGHTEIQKPYTLAPKSVDDQGRVWGIVNAGSTTAPGYYDAATNALVWYPVRGFLAPKFDKEGVGGEKLDAINEVLPLGKFVWLTSWNRMGVLRLNLETGAWTQFYMPKNEFNRVFRLIPRNNLQFWLLTDTYLTLFDTTTETLYEYPHQTDNPLTPTLGSRPYQIGSGGTFWMGMNRTNNATLTVLHETKQPFRLIDSVNYSNPRLPRTLYRTKDLRLVTYQTPTHLVVAEETNQSRTKKMLYQLPLNGFVEQYVGNPLIDTIHKTVLLTGQTTAGSVFQYDLKRHQFTPVRATIQGLPPGENDLANYDEIRSAVQDKAGNVWLPSFGAAGKYAGNLLKFDHQTGRFVGFRAGTHGLPLGQIRMALVDDRGQLWLGYRGGGQLARFDPATSQATSILPNTQRDGTDIIRLTNDPARQLIWIARFEDGLWAYDQRKRTARRVLNEPVLNVHVLKNGLLWLKTATALVRYNPDTGEQTRFGSEYGLQNFTFSAFIKDPDEEAFQFEQFRFRAADVRVDTTPPRLVISFLNVFDKPLLLPQAINHIPAVTLAYDQNFFTVGFSLLSYLHPTLNQYHYRLEGFNPNWVSVGNKPLATFTNVLPGTYPLYLRGRNSEGIQSQVRTLTVTILPPFWQTWWFRLLMIALLVAAVVMLYRFQLERRTLQSRLEAEEAKRKQSEAELKEKEAAYRLKLSATEMAALRSQMNPHFIFNCLNSIQFFTAQNDAEKASDYLTKFSRLIRLVLENSKSERVTLQNELETLRLYIDMETMRFGQKVSYEIRVSNGIDTDTIEIPPLLLQPFVENAIWHGLMHKEEGGMVRVLVQQPQPNRLRIEIVDNGVGRAKAAEYKSKSATKHKSFGLQLTADRIELINQLYQTHTQVQVEDLVDERGKPAGTRVIVEIPV